MYFWYVRECGWYDDEDDDKNDNDGVRTEYLRNEYL